MLKKTLKGMQTVGEYTQYLGLGLIFTMAVVGTVAIDIVILAAMMKAANESSRRGQNNPFVTLMLWNMMFNSPRSHPGRGYRDFGLELLLAPVTTGIAIVLAVCLGVPQIAVALIAGWVAALGVLALGSLIKEAAQSVIDYLDSAPARTASGHSNITNSYEYNQALEARQEAERAHQPRDHACSSNPPPYNPACSSNPPPYNLAFFTPPTQAYYTSDIPIAEVVPSAPFV